MDEDENTDAAMGFYRAHHFRDHRDTRQARITFATEGQERTFTADVHLVVSGYDTPRLILLTPLDIAAELPTEYRVRFGAWRFDSTARALSIVDHHRTHGRYETTFEICS
jgi:hypothetical protein